MKRKLISMILILALIISLIPVLPETVVKAVLTTTPTQTPAPTPMPIPVTSVSISKTSLSIQKGKPFKLIPTINPTNASNKKVTWKSSNKAIATVTSNGTVLGIKNGSCYVIVTTVDGMMYAMCKVSVVNGIAESELSEQEFYEGYDYMSLPLNYFDEITQTASFRYVERVGSNIAISWTVYNHTQDKNLFTTIEIYKLNSSGNLEFVNSSTVNDNFLYKTFQTITDKSKFMNSGRIYILFAISDDQNNAVYADTRAIKVYNPYQAYTELPTPTPTPSPVVTATPFTTATPDVTATPTPTANPFATPTPLPTLTPTPTPEVTWDMWYSPGSYYRSKSFCIKSLWLYPTAPAYNFDEYFIVEYFFGLNKSMANMKMGQTTQLLTAFSPVDIDAGIISWSSSNSKIASVSSTGKVTANSPGIATISVNASYGNKTETCNVTVIQPVFSVELNKASISLSRYKSYRLIANIFPSNASNKRVIWKSSNNAFATVSPTGTVKGIKKGTCYVTAVTVDGKKSARCRVSVK